MRVPTSEKNLLKAQPTPLLLDPSEASYEGTDDQSEGRRATQTTQTTTSTMFVDDETIAQVLLNMSQAKAVSREKEKGETEEERKILAEEEDTNDALIRNYDDIKARIEADRLLADKLSRTRKRAIHSKERSKIPSDTIAAQRRFLAQQRSEAIE
ncbi:hypothetical protein Tco_1238842 [Tanacetum coccineum]